MIVCLGAGDGSAGAHRAVNPLVVMEKYRFVLSGYRHFFWGKCLIVKHCCGKRQRLVLLLVYDFINSFFFFRLQIFGV
ncbi:MAG: hypothetical protein OEV91_04685 [Desulfobulbaceae bacterium]|nr:hypothetical protein [Desulfobulbaceae bacterium]